MFKIGDVVECLDSGENLYITPGEHYSVVGVGCPDIGCIEIIDDKGMNNKYYSSRFKLLEEKEMSVKEQIEKLKKDLELLEKKYQEEQEGPEPAPGQLWQDLDKGYEHKVYIVNHERILIDIRTGGFYSSSSTFGRQGKRMFKYLGMAEELISIKGM